MKDNPAEDSDELFLRTLSADALGEDWDSDDDSTYDTCTCGRIAIGMEITDFYNWHPDCPAHGLGTDWFNSDEQVARRKEDRSALIERYRLAHEAREGRR